MAAKQTLTDCCDIVSEFDVLGSPKKHSVPSKPLHEILSEMMAEAGPMIFQAMQR